MSKASFNNIKSWITDLKQNTPNDLKLFLIGNKSDLTKDRQITYEEAIDFMYKNNIDHFEETSAKEGVNIDEIFKKGINLLYSGYLKFLETYISSNNYNTNSIYNTCNSNNNIILKPDLYNANDSEESNNIQNNRNCSC